MAMRTSHPPRAGLDGGGRHTACPLARGRSRRDVSVAVAAPQRRQREAIPLAAKPTMNAATDTRAPGSGRGRPSPAPAGPVLRLRPPPLHARIADRQIEAAREPDRQADREEQGAEPEQPVQQEADAAPDQGPPIRYPMMDHATPRSARATVPLGRVSGHGRGILSTPRKARQNEGWGVPAGQRAHPSSL